MKVSKKLVALLLSLVMVLAFSACGTPAEPTEPADPAAPAEPADPAEPVEGEGLKICIVTSTGIDDGSFNQNCYEGAKAFVDAHPECTLKDVKEPDYSNLIPTVEELVGDYDIFVLPGFNFAAVGDVVLANPDTYFIVVDSTITDSQGNPVTAENVYTMTFAEQESAFFAGIAAAMHTESGKVAVVNGMAFPSNVNYQYGFMCGVTYANNHFGTAAECVELPSYAGVDVLGNNVGGNYIGDFGDEATGKVVGDALIAEGCDVLFVAAGNAGNGVFTAAKEAEGVWLIGCDVDQYDDGSKGSENIMLTSALKKMDIHVEKQLDAIYHGAFAGEDAFLNIVNEGVGFVSEEGRQQLSAEALENMNSCVELLLNGTIVPAADATANEYTPDNFPGM